MATFAELYSRETGCPPEKAARRIFWRTLHWHAVPFAPLLLFGAYFDSDHELIRGCLRASSMRQVSDEIRSHRGPPQRGRWLHRQARMRVSTQRIRRLAAGLWGNDMRTRGARPV
jgi:hypothetical protein